MKYTIEGLSQRICIELGLDNKDICILRFIIDFYSTGKMKKIIYENKEFIWVCYETLIQEIPIIGIKDKGSLSERLKKMVNAGILKRYIKKDNEGSFSYYHLIPDMIYKLQSDNYQKTLNLYENEEGGYRSKPGRGTGQNRDGVPVKTGDKDSSTNNPSTINSKSNKVSPENSGDSLPPDKNNSPVNLNKISKKILPIVKKTFSAVAFTNVLPDDEAETCNTKTYQEIQNFLYNLHELKLRTAYEWNDKWLDRNHIDFKALREHAVGTNGSTRLPFEEIEKMLKKALKNYKLMFQEDYSPEKKEMLTLNFKHFLYNYNKKTSWFLACLFNDPVKSPDKNAENIIKDLPGDVIKLIKRFGEGDIAESWSKYAFYSKMRDLYTWYEPRRKQFKKYHDLLKIGGFWSKLGTFQDLIDVIFEYICTWRDDWTVNNFGRNCKTWNLFVKWVEKEFGFDLDLDDDDLKQAEKDYDERYGKVPVGKGKGK